jgi:Zn-dependent protease
MIDETPYDLRWRMFGIPCRVHPFFWLAAFILSWGALQYGLPHLFAGVFVVFFSILIHELGHVVVMRWFGSRAHIVLWACGGLAIPEQRAPHRWQRIAISAAGPFAQFLLFGATLLLMMYLPRSTDPVVYYLTPGYVPEALRGPYNSIMASLLAGMLFVNFFWPILNLLPIWPLDGGQISRELFQWGSPRNGTRISLQLSMGVAGLLALLALIAHQRAGQGVELPSWIPSGPQNAIFFAVFIFISYQALMLENARDHWSDDPWS